MTSSPAIPTRCRLPFGIPHRFQLIHADNRRTGRWSPPSHLDGSKIGIYQPFWNLEPGWTPLGQHYRTIVRVVPTPGPWFTGRRVERGDLLARRLPRTQIGNVTENRGETGGLPSASGGPPSAFRARSCSCRTVRFHCSKLGGALSAANNRARLWSDGSIPGGCARR